MIYRTIVIVILFREVYYLFNKGSFRNAGELLVLVFTLIDFVVTLFITNFSKVQILKGGMYNMSKLIIKKVKVVLDNFVVKAILLTLGIWLCYPQP